MQQTNNIKELGSHSGSLSTCSPSLHTCPSVLTLFIYAGLTVDFKGEGKKRFSDRDDKGGDRARGLADDRRYDECKTHTCEDFYVCFVCLHLSYIIDHTR